MRSADLRRRLVAELEAGNRLSSARVRRAFLRVPREVFVPEFAAREGLEAVYRDDAIVTRADSHGMPTSSSSQPGIMALMLERLALEQGHRVLEVGAGTGYNAALLAEIVGPKGRVVSVELDPELARSARAAVARTGSKARVICGDGRLGWARRAPYDRIVVTASAAEIPEAWVEQLRPGGRLEVPVRLTPEGAQVIPTLRKEGGELRSVSVLAGGFVPLRAGADGSAVAALPATVSVTEVDGPESRAVLRLSGRGLASMSATARRRLVALALSPPRTRRLALREDGRWSLFLYLALAIPGRSVVTSWLPDAASVGLVERAGRSLALFTSRRDGPARLEAYGEPVAEERLLALVASWRSAGRPGAESLAVSVASDAPRRLRWRWASSAR